jgi:predicted site-specific integrase-resolvase
MKSVLYARVSTAEQTLAHQLTQTKATGFQINEVVDTLSRYLSWKPLELTFCAQPGEQVPAG